MANKGRPGIPYEKFVEVWESLIKEQRATTNAAHDILGGSKSTIASYRERYERDKSSRTLSFINSIQLTEAMHQAIATIKVKEVEELEKINTQLKSRIDEYLTIMKESQEKLSAAKVDLDEAKVNFDVEKLSLERKLAAAKARIEDLEKREKNLLDKCDQLNDQHNQSKQEAAVAKKEVEMLREQNNRLIQ